MGIGTPREDALQTPTGNGACAMSCQENTAGSLEGDTEMRVGRNPASSSQSRKTRWSRGLPIASCDPCRTSDRATVPSLSEISDCRHGHQRTSFSYSKEARWRDRGISTFKASVHWAASAEDSSCSKHSDMPLDCSLPMSTTQPAVAACGREIEALQEDLAQRAKQLTERLRSDRTFAVAMDGGSTSSVDTEFVEEAKYLQRVITQLLMTAHTQEGRSPHVVQQPCRTRAHSAPQRGWQDASTFDDRFDTLVAGSPLPFCAPSTVVALSADNQEATTRASGSVEIERHAARVDSPRSWAALTSCAHMSPRTPQQLSLRERASSTHASPMFGTNLISQSMSPSCSGPRSKAEVTLPEQQWSALRHESRKRRWGSRSNRPT